MRPSKPPTAIPLPRRRRPDSGKPRGANDLLSFFDLIAALLVLSALFGWLNHRFVHLPNSVGLLVMGLAASLVTAGVGVAFPGSLVIAALTGALRQIDFSAVVFNGMLAFLLFAGSLGLDESALRGRAVPVVLVLSFAPGTLTIALAAMPIVPVARLLAVAAPIVVFPWKPVILAATYAVVLFTLIVQGSTVGFVARRMLRPRARPSSSTNAR